MNIDVSKDSGLEIMEYILTKEPPLSLTKERSTGLETKQVGLFLDKTKCFFCGLMLHIPKYMYGCGV